MEKRRSFAITNIDIFADFIECMEKAYQNMIRVVRATNERAKQRDTEKHLDVFDRLYMCACMQKQRTD